MWTHLGTIFSKPSEAVFHPNEHTEAGRAGPLGPNIHFMDERFMLGEWWILFLFFFSPLK